MNWLYRMAVAGIFGLLIAVPSAASAKTMTGYCIDGNSYIVKSDLFRFEAGSEYPETFTSNRHYRSEPESVFDRPLALEWEATLRKFYNRADDYQDLGFCYVYADQRAAEDAYQKYNQHRQGMKIVPFTPKSPRSAIADAKKDQPKPSEPPRVNISAPSLVVRDTSVPPAPAASPRAILEAQQRQLDEKAKAAAGLSRANAKYQAELKEFFAALRRRGRAQ